MKAVMVCLLALLSSGLAASVSLGSGDCSDYIDLSGRPLPIIENGTTVGATNDYGPFPSLPPTWQFYWALPSAAGPDLTYKWTAPHDGRYTFSLLGSAYDTCLLLYRFTCPSEPTFPDDLLTGTDDAIDIRQSELYCVTLSAGQEVLIVVDGYGGRAGAFRLSISEYHPVQNTAELNAFIESTMETYHVAGLSATAFRGEEVVWSRGYGHADVERDIALADSTLLMLSMTCKPFVSVALMQLWEQGLFELDDDINLYLPWTVHNPAFPAEPITMRMLMSFTSGILDGGVLDALTVHGSDSPIALDYFLYNYLTPGGAYYSELNFDASGGPGTRCRFSHVAVALGGYLVERIDPFGRSFEDYCQQEIFLPLGMRESSWFLANLDQSHIAIPYSWSGRFNPMQHEGVPYYPARQLRTSSSQAVRLLQMANGHGEVGGTRILESATVDSILTLRSTETDGWYCHGFFWVTLPWCERQLWGSIGAAHGYRTLMLFSREENVGAAVLTNMQDGYSMFLVLQELLELAGTMDAPDGALAPVRLVLGASYPNPFGASTTIPFYISAPATARLGIYDVTGRRVASLAEGAQGAGLHVITWDARDAASGIYYTKLDAGGSSVVRRLVRIR